MKDTPNTSVFRVEFPELDRTSIVGPGTTILAAARKVGVAINCVCGGEGDCGKCRVVIEKGRVRTKTNSSPEGIEVNNGPVLACLSEVLSDVEVSIPEESRIEERPKFDERQEATYGLRGEGLLRYPHKPLCRRKFLELPLPGLSDNLSDFERVKQALIHTVGTPVFADYEYIRTLPDMLRRSGFKTTVTFALREGMYEILHGEIGDTAKINYGIALDVGTTTVIANLVNLNTGKVCASSAVYNSQIRYGADVITRIMYAQENREGLEELHGLILQDINTLVGRLTVQAGIRADEIYSMVCTSNTVMIHFLLGMDPKNIRREPYIPVIAEPPAVHAGEIGIAVHPRGNIGFLPGFGAWVGSDITAAILASGMNLEEKISLLIDVGTNGEIVLGCRDWLICCSSSAGPAFEGAGTACGVRATSGAIEKVRITEDGSVKLGLVVGSSSHKPIGICGSGYIDLVAELFTEGFIDRTGRFKTDNRNSRIRKGENGLEFLLADRENSATGNDIVITEDDIITLIRTKGSMYTAAESILNHVGLSWDSIDNVFISGGFGNHLDVERSIIIGLLPDLDREKFHFIGNGSIAGAQMCLLSEDALIKSREVAQAMTYFDLSTDTLFMKEYSSSLFLPHTDLHKFPSVVNHVLP
jgi:uncharacterized 2Fe-2S/4Fe-4S cluster protein (DUF4445 family)